MEAKILNALEASNLKFRLGQNFLLVGSDAFLTDTVTKQIKSQLRIANEIDITIVYADEAKSGELAEHLDTFTIFSSDKLVILKNCELFHKKELEVLASYFDAPSDAQSVIITAEKIDARLSTWKKILSGTVRINCDPPRYGGEIRAWLVAELKRMGKSMSPKAIEEFSSRIELDYFSAANELVKIDLLAQDRRSFNEADVMASLGTTRTGTLIDFFRALGKRKAKPAIEAVELMLAADWEPLQVFFQLYKFYSVLYKIVLLRKNHISDSEISSKHIMEVYLSQRKEYLEFARAYSISALEAIMVILLDTDSKLKSSNVEKNLQLGLSILALMEAK